MQINISYTLYTDGDYSLRNAEDFGCTNRDVVVDDFEYYDYVGSMEFKYEEEWRCKSEAKDFLWRFYVMEFIYLIHILGYLKTFMTLWNL